MQEDGAYEGNLLGLSRFVGSIVFLVLFMADRETKAGVDRLSRMKLPPQSVTFARRCGVYLALAALTLQVALSFGHFHRHEIAYPSLAHSKIGIVDSQALTKLKLSKQLPSPLADDDADCPICFSTLLLAASFVPDAPQHSPSSDFKDVDRFFDRTFDLVFGSDRTPFQSRAPPLS